MNVKQLQTPQPPCSLREAESKCCTWTPGPCTGLRWIMTQTRLCSGPDAASKPFQVSEAKASCSHDDQAILCKWGSVSACGIEPASGP